jgi:hypothetical protein
MKIPVCPKCHEPNTLKLVEVFTELAARVRCLTTHGGCGESFSILGHLTVYGTDGPVEPVELYRDEHDQEIKGNRRKKAKA